ncbi:MBL fold metallo-hydrolase [Streptomyces sp. NPDC090798]|uniref:MBL fold metallo-hydrolase n=1 Tax=Streptomyces sp. NPDC090798 TaxID=3365968 RepID=UPI0038062B1B
MRTIDTEEGSLPAVCHCLLVETDRDGLVLVDSGIGTQDVARPEESLGPGFLGRAQPVLDLAETALHQVTALGFRPEDVRHVVLGHLHLDHAGGLPDFPWARVHLSEAEHHPTGPGRAAPGERCPAPTPPRRRRPRRRPAGRLGRRGSSGPADCAPRPGFSRSPRLPSQGVLQDGRMVRVGSGAGGAADWPAVAHSPVGASARAWRGRFRGRGARRRVFSRRPARADSGAADAVRAGSGS